MIPFQKPSITDIEKNYVTPITKVPKGVYTGAGIADKNGYYYFISFGTLNYDWNDHCEVHGYKLVNNSK